jgi:hypothetical protein
MKLKILIAVCILTASRLLVAWCVVLGCSLSMTAARSSLASAEPQIAAPVLGRFVRIEHRGTRPGAIEIAEVEVYSDRVNIASMGEASEGPGTWSPAELAIDGVENGDLYYKRSTAITPQAVGAFWELAFPKPAKIDRLVVYVRPEDTCAPRNNGVWLSVLNAERHVIWEQQMAKAPDGPQFRAEFPVTVLHAANNATLAAAEVLAVPASARGGVAAGTPWDVKTAGLAPTPALGFSGGRTEASAGGFALLFGREESPFQIAGSLVGVTSQAKLENGSLRWQAAENQEWTNAEAV